MRRTCTAPRTSGSAATSQSRSSTRHSRRAEGLVKRFQREAESAASLTHRHIVAIYDRGEWNETHYIAMEYVAGRSLKSVIRDEAPLESARAIDLTVQILRAAGAIHSRGIIHRDLKPHNVIVDAAGRLKVTDFGIAWAGASDITEAGSVFGSAITCRPSRRRAVS